MSVWLMVVQVYIVGFGFTAWCVNRVIDLATDQTDEYCDPVLAQRLRDMPQWALIFAIVGMGAIWPVWVVTLPALYAEALSKKVGGIK